jgi:NAD(P)-dependent dehydrogenase (short-subunit alcohol dehydrogenase family)
MEILSMHTLLITGTNRGIGFELTKQYLQDGWRVFACCRKPVAAEKLQKLHQQHPETLTIHALDITDPAAIQKLGQSLQHDAVDILINNAGMLDEHESHLSNVDPEVFMDVIRTNALAPLLVAKALLPSLAKGQLKIIANISSTMGSITENISGGYYAYRASKAALNAITKSLSIDLADRGITVLSLHPGWVQTDMGGVGATITPEESVSGLRQILQKTTLADSGGYIAFNGRAIPW